MSDNVGTRFLGAEMSNPIAVVKIFVLWIREER